MVKPGERVGAVLMSDNDTVHLLGYGVFDGWHYQPDIESRNPRITLDTGTIVWGFQCWWGSEEEVREFIAGRQVIPATIHE
jgi:hypothetical protein